MKRDREKVRGRSEEPHAKHGAAMTVALTALAVTAAEDFVRELSPHLANRAVLLLDAAGRLCGKLIPELPRLLYVLELAGTALIVASVCGRKTRCAPRARALVCWAGSLFVYYLSAVLAGEVPYPLALVPGAALRDVTYLLTALSLLDLAWGEEGERHPLAWPYAAIAIALASAAVGCGSCGLIPAVEARAVSDAVSTFGIVSVFAFGWKLRDRMPRLVLYAWTVYGAALCFRPWVQIEPAPAVACLYYGLMLLKLPAGAWLALDIRRAEAGAPAPRPERSDDEASRRSEHACEA